MDVRLHPLGPSARRDKTNACKYAVGAGAHLAKICQVALCLFNGAYLDPGSNPVRKEHGCDCVSSPHLEDGMSNASHIQHYTIFVSLLSCSQSADEPVAGRNHVLSRGGPEVCVRTHDPIS